MKELRIILESDIYIEESDRDSDSDIYIEE